MNSITSFIKRYPLITFFGATISLGWFLTLIMTLLPLNPLLLPLIAVWYDVRFKPAVFLSALWQLAQLALKIGRTWSL